MTPTSIIENLDRIGARETADRLCRSYGVTITDMLESRMPTATAARHRLWMLVRHTLSLSYPEIGRVFGCDHTTVISGVRKAEAAQGLRVPDRHVAGLGKDLAQDAGVGVEAEQAQGSGGDLAEDDGRQEGAAGGGRGDAAGERVAGRIHTEECNVLPDSRQGVTSGPA